MADPEVDPSFVLFLMGRLGFFKIKNVSSVPDAWITEAGHSQYVFFEGYPILKLSGRWFIKAKGVE